MGPVARRTETDSVSGGRQDFLDNYFGNELKPDWLDKVSLLSKQWKKFVRDIQEARSGRCQTQLAAKEKQVLEVARILSNCKTQDS